MISSASQDDQSYCETLILFDVQNIKFLAEFGSYEKFDIVTICSSLQVQALDIPYGSLPTTVQNGYEKYPQCTTNVQDMEYESGYCQKCPEDVNVHMTKIAEHFQGDTDLPLAKGSTCHMTVPNFSPEYKMDQFDCGGRDNLSDMSSLCIAAQEDFDIEQISFTTTGSIRLDKHDIETQFSPSSFKTSSQEDELNTSASQVITVPGQSMPVRAESSAQDHFSCGENTDSPRLVTSGASIDTDYIHLPQFKASTHNPICVSHQEDLSTEQIGFCSDTLLDDTQPPFISPELDNMKKSLEKHDVILQHSLPSFQARSHLDVLMSEVNTTPERPLQAGAMSLPHIHCSGHKENVDSPRPGAGRVRTDPGYIHLPLLGNTSVHSRCITPLEEEHIDFCSDTLLDDTSLCIPPELDTREANSYNLDNCAQLQHSLSSLQASSPMPNVQPSDVVAITEQYPSAGTAPPPRVTLSHLGDGEYFDSPRPPTSNVITDTGYIHLPQLSEPRDTSTHTLLCIPPWEEEPSIDTVFDETSPCVTPEQDKRQGDSYSLEKYNADLQHSCSFQKESADSSRPVLSNVITESDYIYMPQLGDTTHSLPCIPSWEEELSSDTTFDETL